MDVNYVSYNAALEMCGLKRLSDRREEKMLSFSLKCLKTDFCKDLFPENDPARKEKFHINFARTEQYFKSAIPQCQRTLNNFYKTTVKK